MIDRIMRAAARDEPVADAGKAPVVAHQART